VRILVDTNVLLWAVIDPGRLSHSVRSALEDPGNEVLFSAASIWEIAIKKSLGRADFRVQPSEIIDEAVASGFVELPVNSSAALKVADLPFHHRDPFDRLLVAQAITQPAALYTADAQLAAYSELVVVV
jgi:PIN domain nuclease of toxin-antitoxin system